MTESYRPTIYEDAIDVWGVNNMKDKTSEELGELLVAMYHYFGDMSTEVTAGQKVSRTDLATEIADVEIMCNQLRCLVGNDLVNDCKISKLKRLRERINNAKEKKEEKASGN